MKKLSRIIAVISAAAMAVASLPAAALTSSAASISNYQSLFTSHTISDCDTINASLNYQLYVPENYDASKSYPVLMFMHGAGERGIDNRKQITTSTLMNHYFTTERVEKYPCIIIAPQCPENMTWAAASAGDTWNNVNYNMDSYEQTAYQKLCIQILAKVESEYSTDITRRYITGISMGGFGTWSTIQYYPDVFAAAAPCCGGCDPTQAESLSDMAIWAFHGAADTTVPPEGSRKMYDNMAALSATDSSIVATKYVETESSRDTEDRNTVLNSTFIYTEYTGVGHGCWDYAFEETLYYDWMFAQRNTDAAPLTYTAKCGSNLCYKGTLFDDGSVNYASVASTPLSAADGSLGSAWQYRALSLPSYIGITFEASSTADKVLLYWDKGSRPGITSAAYTIQYTTNGTTWNDVANPAYTFGTLKAGAVRDIVTFDAVNATGFRVYITKASSGAAPKLYEFAFFNTADAVENGSMGTPAGVFDGEVTGSIEIDGENLAPQGTAFDDGGAGYYSPDSVPAGINDGNKSTNWQYSSYKVPCHVGVTFNHAIEANTVAIYWEDGSRATAARSGYLLEYTADGTTWNEVPNPTYRYGTAEDGVTQDIVTFNSFSVKGIRCNILSGSNTKFAPKIFEMEVYNVTGSSDVIEGPFGITFNPASGLASGIAEKTEAGTFYSLTVKSAAGTVLASYESVCTGCTIEYEGKKYTCVVKGDVNGDGSVGTADFLMVRDAYLEKISLSGANLAAGCVSGKNDVTTADFLRIRDHFLQKTNLYA